MSIHLAIQKNYTHLATYVHVYLVFYFLLSHLVARIVGKAASLLLTDYTSLLLTWLPLMACQN